MKGRMLLACALIALVGFRTYGKGGTNQVVFAAAEQGDVPRLKELFAADANLLSVRNDLLRSAALHGQKDTVEFLIVQGGDVNEKGFFDMAPLAHMAMYGTTNDEQCAAVATVLIAHGAEVDPVDRYGATPLLHSVESHKVRLARGLLEHGANPARPRDGTKLTPMSFAVRQRHLDTVELLLDFKASGDILDPDGNMSLLVWAIQTRNHELARLLIEHGTPLTPPRTLPAGTWNPRMINVDQRMPVEHYNSTHVPLLAAIRMRDTEALALMLKFKAPLDSVDQDGNAPLHWAVQLRDTNLVKLLLEAKAPVTATNYGGATPLLLAETAEDSVLTKMLRQAAIDQGVSVTNAIVPTREAMRAIAQRICGGDSTSIDELADTVQELFRDWRQQPEGWRQLNGDRVSAAFQALGEEAGKGNDNALWALRVYLGRPNMKGSAVDALAIAAAAGSEESLNLLLRYRDWNLLENTVAFALAAPAKANKERAVDFFVTLAVNPDSVKHNYYGVGWLVKEVLETSATNGNANARQALDKFLAASNR
jgi:ankyrin repeat protein